jgi:hypothetical protein
MALANLVRDAGGITHDELTTRAARLYGWTRRGPTSPPACTPSLPGSSLTAPWPATNNLTAPAK